MALPIIVPKDPEDTLSTMICKARAHRTTTNTFTNNLQDIQAELKQRRMAFLGSSVPLLSIVGTNDDADEDAIVDLSNYLAELTDYFWETDLAESERFCRQFYVLGIKAIANPTLQSQCMDDLISLAELLTREPKDVYIATMKDLLPEDWHGLLFYFTDSIRNDGLTPVTHAFEDAVLGAISVCLGVMEDPRYAVEWEVAYG